MPSPEYPNKRVVSLPERTAEDWERSVLLLIEKIDAEIEMLQQQLQVLLQQKKVVPAKAHEISRILAQWQQLKTDVLLLLRNTTYTELVSTYHTLAEFLTHCQKASGAFAQQGGNQVLSFRRNQHHD